MHAHHSPPGLAGSGSAHFASYAQPQQQGQQGQQQQQQPHSSPQPDLSSVGAHTSNAQLAALLASVQGPPPELQQPQQAQATSLAPSAAAAGFGGNAGFSQAGATGGFGGGFGGAGNFGNSGGYNAGGYGGGNSNNLGGGGYGGGGNGGGFGPTSSNPCRMHQQGHCRYGASCRFTHIGPAGSGASQGGFGGSASSNSFGMGGGNSNNSHVGASFGPGRSFGQGFREFVPQAQQQQQHAVDSKHDSASEPQQQQQQAPAQVPSASNANVALLQALMLQQMNGNASGQSNPQLDELIASLAKTQLGGGTGAGAAPAASSAAAAAAAPPNAQAQEPNLEFLQAQAALASLAAISARPPQQQQPQQQMQQGGGGSYGQSQQRPYGNQNSGGYGNQQSTGGYGNKYGGGGGGHSHHSHSQPLSSFHAGGNFGGSGFPLQQGPPAHLRIFSDHTARDPRREAELFGPAHTMPTGLNFDRYNDIPVEVTGNDVPGEMKSFSDFEFPDVIRQNIELARYKNPTPIQRFALPVAFLGRDLMACAQTGSGKTAAFLLPFIAHLVINGRPAPAGGAGRNRRYMPVGLILAPTRELATQIWEESLKFTYLTSIHSVVVYGGQDIRQQFRELDRGCDVLVGTPGRLADFVERGRISLSQISYLCLDEADRMLDMGFEPAIRNLVMAQDMTENRQTLMFSATFPKEIQRLAQDFLYNYIFIAVGRVGASSDFITQNCMWVEEEQKRVQLMQLLPNCKGLTLIFVERKKSADLLETYLNREGFHASSIHGDRSQHERESALAQFRSGRVPILVATDVAARGLDIPNVIDVINNAIDDYVHRIGRTGRAGNVGNAHSFVNDKASHMFKDLYEMLHENKQVVPAWLASLVEQSGRGPHRGGQQGGGGNRRFGAKDYRKGGYGQHSGGRGGMAQGGLAKMGRFQPHHQQQQQQHGGAGFNGPHQQQQQHQQQPQQHQSFPSQQGGFGAGGGAGGFGNGARGHAQSAAGGSHFAMGNRSFAPQQGGGQ